jgi:hypothetical protein
MEDIFFRNIGWDYRALYPKIQNSSREYHIYYQPLHFILRSKYIYFSSHTSLKICFTTIFYSFCKYENSSTFTWSRCSDNKSRAVAYYVTFIIHLYNYINTRRHFWLCVLCRSHAVVVFKYFHRWQLCATWRREIDLVHCFNGERREPDKGIKVITE